MFDVIVAASGLPTWIGVGTGVGGLLAVVGLVAAGRVVVRSSSTEKLLELRRSIEDAQAEQLKLRDQKIDQLTRDNETCMQRYTDLEGKYKVLQDQVSGTDAIVHTTQILMERHSQQTAQHQAILEQGAEMIKILRQIRRSVGSRNAPAVDKRAGARTAISRAAGR